MTAVVDFVAADRVAHLGVETVFAVTDASKMTGGDGLERFRRLVLDRTGVSFCTRLHFGRALDGETEYCLRLAYSGVSSAQIEQCLGKIKAFIAAAWPTSPQGTSEERRR